MDFFRGKNEIPENTFPQQGGGGGGTDIKCNRTELNIYLAVSWIFEPIEYNRAQSDSILCGIHPLISKSRRTNEGDGAPYKMSAL